MSVSLIRAGIKAKIETVAGTNKVLDYVVWTDDWQTIYEKFAEGTSRVNTWMVGLGSSGLAVIGNGYKERPYTFNIIGYYSIKSSDETSKTFEDLIASILDAFDGTNSVSVGSVITTPMSVAGITNTMYVQHPCHSVNMSITITDKVANSGLCG